MVVSRAIRFRNGPIAITGSVPRTNDGTRAFALITGSLSSIALNRFTNGHGILGVFPDVSANIYTTSMHGFGRLTARVSGAIILYVSTSLPFTRSHFYNTRNLGGIVALSAFHGTRFLRTCNITVTSNPLGNLTTHTIIIVSRGSGIVFDRLISRVAARPSCRTTLTMLGTWIGVPSNITPSNVFTLALHSSSSSSRVPTAC